MLSKIDELKLAHQLLVNAQGAAATTTTGFALSMGGAFAFAYASTVALGPLAFGIATLAVLGVANSASQWGLAADRLDQWRVARNKFLEYVKERPNVTSWPTT
jgi:hypothetical protein